MELKLISNTELDSHATALLALPYFRPSHRVVNFFDKKNNRIYLTEFQEFMESRREDFNLQTQRLLGVEVDCPGIEYLLPQEIDPAKIITYSVGPNLYFVQVEDRFFAVGERYNNSRMAEQRLDGLSLLGEVGVAGEFRFIFLPRIGMCIRGLHRSDIRADEGSFDPVYAEEREIRRVSYSGVFHLVRANGKSVFEEFGEDADLLRKFLGVSEHPSEESGWRLRNWTYPMLWQGDDEPRRTWGKGELVRKLGSFSNPRVVKDVSIVPGSYQVTVKFEGYDDRIETCIPWLEYAYAETFYGN